MALPSEKRSAASWTWVPIAIISLAGLTLLWSRLMALTQGMWGDEAYSIAHYAGVGPGGIWDASTWVPNDQPLFELVTWATTGLLGSHVEATYRLWGVIPALAGAAAMTAWLWWRFERWTAAVFAVLVAVAPIHFQLGPQARGYGIGFLAAALVVIAADGVARFGSRRWLVLLSVAGFVGIATLQNFVAFYVVAVLVLLLKPARRRPVLVSLVLVGAASLAWYAPLLSKIIGFKNVAVHTTLGWGGVVIGPFRDLLGAGIHTLIPSVSVTVGAIVAAVVLAAGVLLLLREGERTLMLLLTVPVFASYVLVQVATNYTPRFVSFALMPLLTLAAVALVGLARFARIRQGMSVAVACGLVAFALLALGRFARYAAGYATTPIEASSTAAEIVDGATGSDVPRLVLANRAMPSIRYYFDERRAHSPRALISLDREFCSYNGSLAFLDEQGYAQPSLSCLMRRGAFEIKLGQQRTPFALWLVPPKSL